MAKQSTALLGDFFADHPGPATREACVAALVERYRISEARAGEWLEHAVEAGTLRATEAGISPRDLSPAEAVAHVLASHPAGLRWPDIAKRIAVGELCPEGVKRAPRADGRILRTAGGALRHRRFADEPAPNEPPPPQATPAPPRPRRPRPVKRRAAPEPPPPVAPAPRPARELPIVRRRRDPPVATTTEEPESVRVLRAIATAISGSARAIEVRALHEHVVAVTAIEITVERLRSLLVANAVELGWHVRGPFVSRRHIPWADLDEALASAARGHRRDPAELVARVRRLLRITNTTARSIHAQLQRACGG